MTSFSFLKTSFLIFIFSSFTLLASSEDDLFSEEDSSQPKVGAKRLATVLDTSPLPLENDANVKRPRHVQETSGQVYGIATYDALFKYVLSDETITPSFLKAFLPDINITSCKRLDEHMNPIQKLQHLRNFLAKQETKEAVDILKDASNISVICKDHDTEEEMDQNPKVIQFINGVLENFDDFKRAFPRERYNGTMDFICRLDTPDAKEYALVEMQVIPQKDWNKRALAYAANLYGVHLHKGTQSTIGIYFRD